MRQCDKCGTSQFHIIVFENDPTTGEQWDIERCSRCNFAFDLQKHSDYLKNYSRKPNQRRDIQSPFGE